METELDPLLRYAAKHIWLLQCKPLNESMSLWNVALLLFSVRISDYNIMYIANSSTVKHLAREWVAGGAVFIWSLLCALNCGSFARLCSFIGHLMWEQYWEKVAPLLCLVFKLYISNYNQCAQWTCKRRNGSSWKLYFFRTPEYGPASCTAV